jgi:hypothetical protein
LSSRRTIGFSAENPISMADIRDYIDVFEIENREMFMYLIAEMDHEYLMTKYKERPKVDKSQNDLMQGNKF